MKISLKWLNELIPVSLPPDELADKLTLCGLEVEEVIRTDTGFEGVVVGDVLQVEKHPDADRLSVCRVDVGDETLSIVCGAPNVSEGQRVPVARIGARLAGGLEIKPVTLRGVKSEGMICSERELGIGHSHEGILVLDPTSHEKGAAFTGPSDRRDTVFSINVTPNRPDCLSHIGIAREVGVLTDVSPTYPDDSVNESDEVSSDWISIEIMDPAACPRYTARIMRDVQIRPSPDWIKERLEALGVRSINNVVDATNLVMLETGQPLHAFDYDLIAEKKIIVRLAEGGESFTTLDGLKHTLTQNDLLICDGRRGVALAGIMGGENSEVSDRTRNILIESAYFDPPAIRRTSKRLGISTEASQRFERGCDPNNTAYAVNRAAKLISDLTGGSVVKGIVDSYPSKIPHRIVTLRPERITHVLGIEIPVSRVISILSGLGLKPDDSKPISVTIPSFRPDLKQEIDLIEEVVRHYGYDRIPDATLSRLQLTSQENRVDRFVEELKDFFVGRGFFETVSNSMVSEHAVKPYREIRKPVPVQNPLSPDTAFMRSSLIPGLLDTIVWNQNRSQSNLKLFETGRIFESTGRSSPAEREVISAVLTGNDRPVHYWNASEKKFDFHDLKGVVEALLQKLHVERIDFEITGSPIFSDQRAIQMQSDGRIIGHFGLIHESICADWDIRNPVFSLEIDIATLYGMITEERKFIPFSRFPGVKRDLAIIVNESVLAEQVIDVILKTGDGTLQSVDLFDIYRGKAIPPDKKSMAFSLTFSSPDRTLQDSDIDPVMMEIVRKLETRIQARLRT
ncbi:MAG TPA: phenylalanine--tRNA ligase subunit beta [bacterium]|nr:phenylalanine--tRNA ligase subunit beta [bacterium]